jgi:hypothetical protein
MELPENMSVEKAIFFELDPPTPLSEFFSDLGQTKIECDKL